MLFDSYDEAFNYIDMERTPKGETYRQDSKDARHAQQIVDTAIDEYGFDIGQYRDDIVCVSGTPTGNQWAQVVVLGDGEPFNALFGGGYRNIDLWGGVIFVTEGLYDLSKRHQSLSVFHGSVVHELCHLEDFEHNGEYRSEKQSTFVELCNEVGAAHGNLDLVPTRASRDMQELYDAVGNPLWRDGVGKVETELTWTHD